ncbi:hypothetical protein [Streptomyces nojiriensis]|uniref:hypothetical protein n=1 Tax=Streptomyces nojiriensis TaxID=66374 RepID=UPI0016790EC1|nr:hypothetical protein [Streptomyces nojiriensis]
MRPPVGRAAEPAGAVLAPSSEAEFHDWAVELLGPCSLPHPFPRGCAEDRNRSVQLPSWRMH